MTAAGRGLSFIHQQELPILAEGQGTDAAARWPILARRSTLCALPIVDELLQEAGIAVADDNGERFLPPSLFDPSGWVIALRFADAAQAAVGNAAGREQRPSRYPRGSGPSPAGTRAAGILKAVRCIEHQPWFVRLFWQALPSRVICCCVLLTVHSSALKSVGFAAQTKSYSSVLACVPPS
jgi:hypothetical protein